ncbi:MAG: LamG-like jellyroll fold domain-containing protein, partial [bacterium]|nr:LamG-like jellyroll fold domain-containing protein [bacterium]
MGTTNSSMQMWFTGPTGVRKKLIDISGMDLTGHAANYKGVPGYTGLSWNAYANANAGSQYGGVATTETTFRYEDNLHIRAGTPVSCASVGFGGSIAPISGTPPPTPPPSDTTSPTVPASLTASTISSNQINLSWAASTDNVGVSGYRIYRNGTQIATTATNSYSNIALSPATTYSYTVSAYDAAGNTSVQSSSASATTPSAPLPSASYITAYGMNEGSGTTLTDTSGTGHTGTLTTGPTRVASQTGYGQALSFDGVSGSVSVANPSTLNVGTSDFTIEAWVKRNALGTNQRHIFSKCGTTWSTGCKEFYFNRNNQLTFGSYATGDTFSNIIADTSWHHVAATFTDSSNTLNLYVDGILATTATKALEVDGVGHVVTVGNHQNNNTFSGLIDDFRMYSRALTLAEIQSDKATSITSSSISVPDTVAPTVPTGLIATAISSSQINLSWSESTDNTAVTGYRIYRNGTQIATSATNTYSNTSLNASTAYTYAVAAYDAVGNVSAQSASASATTQVSALLPSTQEAICASPFVLMCEDFEERALGSADLKRPTTKNKGWDLSTGALANHGVISTSEGVYDGAKALQLNYPAGGNTGGGFMNTSWNNTDRTIYVRWYEKWSPNFKQSFIATKNMELYTSNGSTDLFQFWSPNVGTTGYMPGKIPVRFLNYFTEQGAAWQPSPNVNGTSEVVLNTDEWYCLEARYTMNTTPTAKDGILQGWVNGIQRWDYTNVNIDNRIGAQGPISGMMVSGYWNCYSGGTGSEACTSPEDQHPLMQRWHDNIVVSTQPIGCLAARNGDTTAPSAPIGLSAITISTTQVNLSWTAVTDNVGIAGYKIYRNGTQIA